MISTVLLLGLMWLFQVVFFRSAYTRMKKSALYRIADTLVAEQKPILTNSSDFLLTASKLAYEQQCCIDIYRVGADGKLQSLSVIDALNQQCLLHSPQTKLDKTQIAQNLASGTKPYLLSSYPRENEVMLLYAQLFSTDVGETGMILLNTYIEPLDSIMSLMTNRLLVITFTGLGLAMLLSLLWATRIASPITRITATARELARGHYDVYFKPSTSYAEINQLADTLNFAAHGLGEVDRLRQELIANVSHDVRTPLTMIRAYAEMLQDFSGEDPVKRAEHLDVIIGEADRLNNMVKNLLDLSQLQTDTTPLADEPFDLAETAARIHNRFEGYAQQRGISLLLDSPDSLFAYGDEPRIEQVFYNLLGNAIRHTDRGGQVGIRIERAPEGHVRASVWDTGNGISPEQLEHIWDRYYSDKDRDGAVSTGLGLSIVRAILEGSGAAYGVDSVLNEGSCFWFELSANPKPVAHKSRLFFPKDR
nr:HAMP domain-containing sensor histidine kinase [bacterium]